MEVSNVSSIQGLAKVWDSVDERDNPDALVTVVPWVESDVINGAENLFKRPFSGFDGGPVAVVDPGVLSAFVAMCQTDWATDSDGSVMRVVFDGGFGDRPNLRSFVDSAHKGQK